MLFDKKMNFFQKKACNLCEMGVIFARTHSDGDSKSGVAQRESG